MYNSQEHLEFFMEVREKTQEIQDIALRYGLLDELAYILVAGIYVQGDSNDEGYHFKAMSDFLVGDEEELDRMLEVGIDSYRQAARNKNVSESLEDLLGGFDISTEDDEQ